MNLESRIEKLESRIGVGNDEIPPLIVINTMDCQKTDSQGGKTPPLLAVVPGLVGGPHGITMFREKDEDPGTFLKRCEAKHAEFYP